MIGEFGEIAAFAQILKTALRRGKNWESLTNDAKESLEQAATSISRILNGDPNEMDHWTRIADYMKLRIDAIHNKALENKIANVATERVRPTVGRMLPSRIEDVGDA